METLARYTPCAAVQAILAWPARRFAVALLAAGATVLVIGVPTALIPNPVFGREIAPTSWAWPSLIATAVLSGLLIATYVRNPEVDDGAGSGDGEGPGGEAATSNGAADAADRPSRAGMVGGVLAYFAVGCPVCNKLALIALGYTGALTWFAPVQPWLAAGGIALLAVALLRRLANEGTCALPGASRGPDGEASEVPAELFARPPISVSTDARPPAR